MKKSLKNNILLLLIAVILLLCAIYGIKLYRMGYTLPDEGVHKPVELALFELSEGLLPWNAAATDAGVAIDNAPTGSAKDNTPTGAPLASGTADLPDPAATDSAGSHDTDPAADPSNSSESGAPSSKPLPGTEPGPEEPKTPAEATNEPLPPSPTWAPVDDAYFDKACFIGDSRIVGLHNYSSMKDHADFYARTGMMAFNMMTGMMEEYKKPLPLDITVDDYFSPDEALQNIQYERIYIMVGINELGSNDLVRYKTCYSDAIERIKELQPDAIIILQAVMHVTDKRDKEMEEKGKRYTNENINRFNEVAMELVDNERVFWLDVNPILDDENGKLNPDLTNDGQHLKASEYGRWVDFLYENGLVWTE